MSSTLSRFPRAALAAALLLAAGLLPLRRATAANPVTVEDAKAVVAQYEATDPGLSRFFRDSAGYAVFPGIGKGGFIVGAAQGDGILFEHGHPVGKITMTQVSVGAQVGGQSYSEVIFFHDKLPLEKLKLNDLTLAAQVSAVGLQSGVSANAKYEDGVAVVTAAKGGLMLEAAVGGQKFQFVPFPGRS